MLDCFDLVEMERSDIDNTHSEIGIFLGLDWS